MTGRIALWSPGERSLWIPGHSEGVGSQAQGQLPATADTHGRVAFLPLGSLQLKALRLLPYAREPRTLGEHMRKRRIENGLRQKDIARTLGINASTLLEWENGRAEPEIRYLPRILAFLGYDPFPTPRSLGERIVARRRELGLSRKHLAQKLGIDEGTLARWERNERRPSGPRARLIQMFLTGCE